MDDEFRAVIEPNLGAEFKAWYGEGILWLAGNPKTCADLAGDSHFWRSDETFCTCGALGWLPRGGEPQPAEYVRAQLAEFDRRMNEMSERSRRKKENR